MINSFLHGFLSHITLHINLQVLVMQSATVSDIQINIWKWQRKTANRLFLGIDIKKNIIVLICYTLRFFYLTILFLKTLFIKKHEKPKTSSFWHIFSQQGGLNPPLTCLQSQTWDSHYKTAKINLRALTQTSHVVVTHASEQRASLQLHFYWSPIWLIQI